MDSIKRLFSSEESSDAEEPNSSEEGGTPSQISAEAQAQPSIASVSSPDIADCSENPPEVPTREFLARRRKTDPAPVCYPRTIGPFGYGDLPPGHEHYRGKKNYPLPAKQPLTRESSRHKKTITSTGPGASSYLPPRHFCSSPRECRPREERFGSAPVLSSGPGDQLEYSLKRSLNISQRGKALAGGVMSTAVVGAAVGALPSPAGIVAGSIASMLRLSRWPGSRNQNRRTSLSRSVSSDSLVIEEGGPGDQLEYSLKRRLNISQRAKALAGGVMSTAVVGAAAGALPGPAGIVAGSIASRLRLRGWPGSRNQNRRTPLSRTVSSDSLVIEEGASRQSRLPRSRFFKASFDAVPYQSSDVSNLATDDDRADSPALESEPVEPLAPTECQAPSEQQAPRDCRAPEGGGVPPFEGPLSRPASPIGTRSRFTYGLDRFEKNAMLIFAQTSPQGPKYVEQRVEMLTRTFGQFRFEVETHVDLDPEQMDARLETFFSRDWTGVGAVCVVAIGGEGETGYLPERAQRCHESSVLQWLTNQLPSALAGKPRIYITEMARCGEVADSAGVYSQPLTNCFPDVITVHIPDVIEEESNPLQMLCSRLGSERDFRAEVMTAAHEAETVFSCRPIQVESTLSLELEFVKDSSNDPNILPSGSSEHLPVEGENLHDTETLETNEARRTQETD